MSEEDQGSTVSEDAEEESPMLTAEYKDGQLQIVQVTPFEKDDKESSETAETDGQVETEYTVLDTGKGLVQLDLLNLTLVRSENGQESYQLIVNCEEGSDDNGQDKTVTCVLQSSDGEEADNQEYMMVESLDSPADGLVYLQQSADGVQTLRVTKPRKQSKSILPHNPAITPAHILENAKAYQKAKALLTKNRVEPPKTTNRGRKRKSDLPPPHELLSSPKFKLYLYECKQCDFKCNATKEMSAHKATAHVGTSNNRAVNGPAWKPSVRQCSKCKYTAARHTLLLKHVQENHGEDTTNGSTVRLDTAAVAAADILVCGACGFESPSRVDFKRHIEDEHGATATCV